MSTAHQSVKSRIVSLAWALGLLLEGLKVFNSHYLAVIQPGD